MPNLRIKINCRHFDGFCGKCKKLPKKRFLFWTYRQTCILIWESVTCAIQSPYGKPIKPPPPPPPKKSRHIEVVVFNGK